jgi:hypothetical protein
MPALTISQELAPRGQDVTANVRSPRTANLLKSCISREVLHRKHSEECEVMCSTTNNQVTHRKYHTITPPWGLSSRCIFWQLPAASSHLELCLPFNHIQHTYCPTDLCCNVVQHIHPLDLLTTAKYLLTTVTTAHRYPYKPLSCPPTLQYTAKHNPCDF